MQPDGRLLPSESEPADAPQGLCLPLRKLTRAPAHVSQSAPDVLQVRPPAAEARPDQVAHLHNRNQDSRRPAAATAVDRDYDAPNQVAEFFEPGHL